MRIAEVESGARRAGFTTLDLNTLAADVADFYEPLAERKSVSLSLQTHGTPAELPGDPSLLQPGATVVIFALKKPDGSLTAARVTAEKDGVKPPM